MSSIPAVLAVRPNSFVEAWRSFRRWPAIPAGVVLILVLAAIFAPLVAPNHPLEGELTDRNVPPAWTSEGRSQFLLGTDYIGRGILSRIIFGSRISLQIAATVLVAGALVGTVVGLAAGYMGGLVDEALMRLVDFVFAMPFIVVALVASVVWGPSLGLVIILLVLFTWAPFARQVRAEALQLKTTGYVALARVAGASGFRIAFRHILPGAVQHCNGALIPPGGLAYPHRVGLELLRDWYSPAGPVVGHDGGRRASIHSDGLVDVLLPRTGHTVDRLLYELLRRLASRPVGPEAEAAIVARSHQ